LLFIFCIVEKLTKQRYNIFAVFRQMLLFTPFYITNIIPSLRLLKINALSGPVYDKLADLHVWS